ncbi:MAG: phenylalanine--tRNA ligase subunit alpha, partial [Chloroflexota bacterium]
MLEELEKLYEKALAELETVNTSDVLRDWQLGYLGRKGEVTLMLRHTGKLPAEERPQFGKRANEIKNLLTEAYEKREALVEEQELAADLEQGEIDITLPGRKQRIGGLHPATQTLREFYRILGDMGFQVFRTREVEDDDHNFTLLNFPPDHPARDMQDTFYTTEKDVILRTHTSPGQIRAMHALGNNGTEPIRAILPGMVYRYEQITARSEVQFQQVEGIAVGKNITMADLKGTIAVFAERFFGKGTDVRFRASYFPFTEPSMEIDVECFLCGGKGCNVCKYTGWLEIGGSGMVHPNVLRNGGYDPEVWSGFAFG